MDHSSRAFSFTGRIRSISHAVRGIGVMLGSQHNTWLHAAATVLVIAMGFVFGITRVEWCFIVVAIVMVWITEALNTAFEFLCDATSPDFHPLVKCSKDVAAGAVLLGAVGALTLGALVFVPYVRAWL